jgi:hypothetical protein
MKRARNGNPGLIKSMGYEGAKGDELGWKHHRPTFSAACLRRLTGLLLRPTPHRNSPVFTQLHSTRRGTRSK